MPKEGRSINKNKLDILDFGRYWFKRSISEILYTKNNKYSVNKKEYISMIIDSYDNVYMPIIKYL